jgi:hypothetical protein
MSNDVRADFEAFARSPAFGLSPGHFERGDDGQYLNVATEAYWLAFRAGRGSLVVELPPVGAPRDDHPSRRRWHNIRNNTLEACKRALEAQGVTVK